MEKIYEYFVIVDDPDAHSPDGTVQDFGFTHDFAEILKLQHQLPYQTPGGRAYALRWEVYMLHESCEYVVPLSILPP